MGNSVSAFTIASFLTPSGSPAGALTPVSGSPFAADSLPSSVTVDPSGKFAYVVNRGSNDVSAFTIDLSINPTAGALTPVLGSPFATGAIPRSVAVDPSGRFAYVANSNSNNVSAFTINSATGALVPLPGSPFAAGTTPMSIIVDPSGKFAYVANLNSSNVWVFAIDATTGALTPVAGSPFAAGTNPSSVFVSSKIQ
jgi:6-phosphogluconolactonase (cycloisomerase 2 family)